MTDAWGEPPLAGSEVEHLLGALDRQRATFRWKVDGLDAEALTVTVGASSLTIGGLVRHLAFVEDFTSTVKLAGVSPGEPWESADWDGPESPDFTPAGTLEEQYALLDAAVDRARARFGAVITEGGLDAPAAIADDDEQHPSVRRLLFDLLEEYARHTGHVDLLREAVDGLIGEDPPPGWPGPR